MLMMSASAISVLERPRVGAAGADQVEDLASLRSS
jgi:hypothetical protein